MSADFHNRDPTADELVQRFRLTSTSSLNSGTPKRPSLTIVKRGSSIKVADAQIAAAYSLNRTCVSSLHQNGRTSLLYGKNNVIVANEGNELKGYLSLHQEANRLTLKWMANQIMHTDSQPSSGAGSPTKQESTDSSQLWKHTIIINIHTIIYIHLHQQDENSPVSLVFVDAEGVQHRPFQFPPGQHCVAFLACLESGLNPAYKLDPPLYNEPGKGKILPQLKQRRRSSLLRRSTDSTDDSALNSPEKHDYVFRIRKLNHGFGMHPLSAALNEFVQKNGSNFQSNSLPNSPALIKKLNEKMGVGPSKPTQKTVTKANTTDATGSNSSTDNHTEPIDVITDACQLMRQQILSRAFYGWLMYCKNMKTIRTHLACTIDNERLEPDQNLGPVDELLWQKCRELKTEDIHRDFLKRCYFHGVKHELRSEVWPYLLKLIPWDKDIQEYLPEWRTKYEKEVAVWSELETEVVKRDSEQFQIARMRQTSNVDEYRFSPLRGNSTCNDVFEMEEVPTPNCVEEKTEQNKLVEEFGTNLHRIEKDVERCDRHTEFFSSRDHLDSLKRVMCTYVMRHLDEGYVQGMCDIAAPLLVIFDDEVITLECFELMMERMTVNFPHGNGIENNLNNLRSIVSVLDPYLHCQLMNEADYTHLYFAYRWFLLDFKREFIYEDVYLVWEVIWASAQLVVSKKFQLFFAFALLTQYREILIENHMDFTDVIKFFNEMAEKHNVHELLRIARDKLSTLQELAKSSHLLRTDDDAENH